MAGGTMRSIRSGSLTKYERLPKFISGNCMGGASAEHSLCGSFTRQVFWQARDSLKRSRKHWVSLGRTPTVMTQSFERLTAEHSEKHSGQSMGVGETEGTFSTGGVLMAVSPQSSMLKSSSAFCPAKSTRSEERRVGK